MLNALRHQRFLHSFPLGKKVNLRGAQRLAASEDFASRIGVLPSAGSTVLNALRHQRFLHVRRVGSRRSPPLVLNALRHQRFLHLRMGWCSVRMRPCSTPCGIRGFCISGCRLPGKACAVLNALRHQRFLHDCNSANVCAPASAQRLAASEVFALYPQRPMPLLATSAQRLAASEVFASPTPLQRQCA